jgi:8-oxo-dGTP pyrophosphatase MutT (NUDIX family)
MPHIHEKIDFTVEVFIVYKNRVLLRKHDKYKIWLSVGGHIELDEDPNQAALREVEEEVGLDVKLAGIIPDLKNDDADYHQLIAPRFLGRHNASPTHEHIVLVYFARSETDKLILEKENDECIWVSKDDIKKMGLRANVMSHALAALEELATS